MSTPSTTVLQLDQEDLTARLSNDALFKGIVQVFSQRRGVTDNDILTALGSVNSLGGKAGLVLIVLMPSLVPQNPDAPGPYYFTRYAIQVIDWPLIRDTTGGTGITAETACERIRMILHFWSTGRGQTLTFDGMEPTPLRDQTQVSYTLHFRRLGADKAPAKPGAVTISPAGGPFGGGNVTLTCATPGVSIYYSLDGSLPSSLAAAATPPTSFLYAAPFALASACTLRASAELAGDQQGDCSQQIFT